MIGQYLKQYLIFQANVVRKKNLNKYIDGELLPQLLAGAEGRATQFLMQHLVVLVLLLTLEQEANMSSSQWSG